MNTICITGYQTSRDYAKLAELARTQSVICIVDHDACRDIAQTIYFPIPDMETWQVSARGNGYITALSKEEFIARCTRLNLEFIMSDAEKQAHQ